METLEQSITRLQNAVAAIHVYADPCGPHPRVTCTCQEVTAWGYARAREEHDKLLAAQRLKSQEQPVDITAK